MRNDERLRTIYEVMAPYIVRNEHNWRDYLAFASQFHKHSFDNILLVYAQDEDVSILATRKQWATIGRNLIPRAKGVAVCVYRNAKLTLDYLFDVSQTTGKEIHPTDWQLSDEMKKALTERLSYAHGFPKQDFPQALYAMASESVAENYNHFLQELKQETKGHLFTEIPAGGFEAQYIQLLTDSISYFIGKKCHLSDEEIQLSDGMATVSHFNTLPLVAHLGTAVTALSKGKADCEYFLSEGHQHEKHLWAGTQREKAPEPDEIIPYRWNARNIRIAVAGSQRRSGVTVTAFNLASWLAARGAEVAYIEVNQNRHLQLLLNIYEAAPDGEHYTIDGIDCYLTNEPDKAYQFIIYDCGVMQTPTSIFRDADHRLLCGSVLPYEIPVFHKALSECGSLEVRPVAICVPQEIQEYCMELFGENVQIAAASHDLFAKRVNGQIYRPLVEKYIAGEKRL